MTALAAQEKAAEENCKPSSFIPFILQTRYLSEVEKSDADGKQSMMA